MVTSIRNTSLFLSFSVAAAFAASSDLRASDGAPCGSGYGKLSVGYLGLTARTSDFPAGSAFREALQDVVEAWSSTRSKAEYAVSFSNSVDPEVGNGDSEVFFVDNLYPQAVTAKWMGPPTCTITEADVLLLESYAWSASTDPGDLYAYGGPSHPIRTVLFHELGHAQGLSHTSTVFSVMGQDENHLHVNDGIATAYPGEDAVTKSVALYGQVNGTYEDLGLAHWERTGSSGQYSLHGRTSVQPGPGATVIKIDFPDDQYEVGIGEKVKMEVTVENFGKGSHDVRIGYYVSSNDHISTGDRFLGSHVKYVTPGAPTTIVGPVLTIPADLADETDYWLGAIIDDNMQLAEVDEWNNRTSIRIRTRELPRNLVASAISGPATKKAGNSASITSTVLNLGGGSVGQFTYEIRLSLNTTITTSDPLVASIVDTSLGFNLDQVTVPANLPAGNYYWGLRVVPVSGESSTTDNTLAGNLVTITKGNPDLVALAVTGPASLAVNDNVLIHAAIGNQGGTANGPFTYRVYLSQDSVIGPSDIEIKQASMSNVGTKDVYAKIPPLPAVGTYRIGIIVEAAPGETSLANNVLLGGYVIVTSIDGTPGGVTGG